MRPLAATGAAALFSLDAPGVLGAADGVVETGGVAPLLAGAVAGGVPGVRGATFAELGAAPLVAGVLGVAVALLAELAGAFGAALEAGGAGGVADMELVAGVVTLLVAGAGEDAVFVAPAVFAAGAGAGAVGALVCAAVSVDAPAVVFADAEAGTSSGARPVKTNHSPPAMTSATPAPNAMRTFGDSGPFSLGMIVISRNEQ